MLDSRTYPGWFEVIGRGGGLENFRENRMNRRKISDFLSENNFISIISNNVFIKGELISIMFYTIRKIMYVIYNVFARLKYIKLFVIRVFCIYAHAIYVLLDIV